MRAAPRRYWVGGILTRGGSYFNKLVLHIGVEHVTPNYLASGTANAQNDFLGSAPIQVDVRAKKGGDPSRLVEVKDLTEPIELTMKIHQQTPPNSDMELPAPLRRFEVPGRHMDIKLRLNWTQN